MSDAPMPPPPPRPLPQPGQIPYDFDDKDIDGTYSNIVYFSFRPSEVILDFARLLPNMSKPRLHSRVILAPHNAKALLGGLEDLMKRYEGQFGPIKFPGQDDSRSIGF